MGLDTFVSFMLRGTSKLFGSARDVNIFCYKDWVYKGPSESGISEPVPIPNRGSIKIAINTFIKQFANFLKREKN